MIKFISFLARRPELTPEAFQRHWREVHAPMWRDMPGLRGYVLNIPLETHARSDVAALDVGEFDGIAQLWFDDLAARRSMTASPAGQRWRADGASFVGAFRTFATEEQWVVPLPAGPRPGVKALTAIRRRADATPEAFHHAWRVGHGGMAAGIPHLRGFLLSGVVDDQTRADTPAVRMTTPLDGFAESWCDDMDARRALVASGQAQRWFADGATFLGQVRTFLLREEIVAAPPG